MADQTNGYRWSKRSIEMISDQLKALRKQAGAITRRGVLDIARDEASPLHPYFDWDDSTAAEKFRLQQAGELIRAVQVFVKMDGVERPIRQFVRVVVEDVPQYLPILEVAREPSLTEQVIQSAKADLEGWLRRYETYQAFFASTKHAKKAIETLPELKTKRPQSKSKRSKAA